MLQICRTHDKDIFEKFRVDGDGLYYNERLENEVVKRKQYSKSRSENRKNKNICSSYEKHMENEDILSINGKVKIAKNEEPKFSGNFRARGEEVMAARIKAYGRDNKS